MTGRDRLHQFPVSQRIRFAWIDAALTETGSIRRSSIVEAFGISMPQASNDLSDFKRLFPGRLRYCLSAKSYLAGPVGKCFSPTEHFTAKQVAWLFVAEMRP
tara:strand:+ start:215 stop:520 length:306 start_codon:yes stop_codon:yes gene_type:complete